MKKLVVMVGLIGGTIFLFGKINAAVPTDQMSQNRTSYIVPPSSTNPPSPLTYPIASNWNTLLSGNSIPASGAAATVTFSAAQTTMTFNGGLSNSTFTARNCLTDVTVTLSNNSTFYILDGGTTNYAVYGSALLDFSGSTASEWTKHWDHLGPLCGTAGNSMTLSIPIPGVATTTNAISAEGYTIITGLASIYNVGQ